MIPTLPLVLAVCSLAGLGALLVRVERGRRHLALVDYLEAVDGPATLGADDLHAGSFLERVLRPAAGGLAHRVGRLTPGSHLGQVHAKLVRGGLSSRVRAEEVVAAEVLAVAAGAGLALLAVVAGDPPLRLAVGLLVLGPVCGLLAVQSWLARHVESRQRAIRKDLADVLDLLALSIEAGLGLEAAMAVVAERLPSPLAVELHLTLREMELGRTRREAFANLKRRTEVPELNAFVSAVLQADALGAPIGRVISAQAAEMRLRRRQWAREQAAKLPVKVLFPLVAFIFPALFVVILGPAVGPLRDAFN